MDLFIEDTFTIECYVCGHQTYTTKGNYITDGSDGNRDRIKTIEDSQTYYKFKGWKTISLHGTKGTACSTCVAKNNK
jgi:hypothetical protein